MEPIPVWRMIKDVVDHLEGELTYAEIKEYINEKWNDVNQNTITAQIIAVTVNHNSRIHYNENKNTRLSNSDSCYDILFYLSRGRVTKYNPLIHGIWEIYKDESDKSRIRLLDRSNCTFLFAWNPHNWEFNEIDQKINELQLTGRSTVIWSIQSHKKVRLGDRAFIVQVGTERKGLFASGYIVSEPKLLQHWGDKDKLVPRVTIELDILINPTHNPILTVAFLKTRFPEQQWTPQSSGIQIKSEIVSDLEKEWFDFIKLKNPVSFVDKKE
ncbi:MAG TPA: hypothetical protein VHD33_06685, partial [Legionellaceae bacterium]|nr:hypothetical protein [Legionellaceae bacterium]